MLSTSSRQERGGVDVHLDHARDRASPAASAGGDRWGAGSPRAAPDVSARRRSPRRRRPARGTPRAVARGGKNRCNMPWRGSTQRAVRTSPAAERPGAGGRDGRGAGGSPCPGGRVERLPGATAPGGGRRDRARWAGCAPRPWPRGANRGAAGSPSANRRARGRGARRAGTRVRCRSAPAIPPDRSRRPAAAPGRSGCSAPARTRGTGATRSWASSRRASNGSTLTGSRRSRHR